MGIDRYRHRRGFIPGQAIFRGAADETCRALHPGWTRGKKRQHNYSDAEVLAAARGDATRRRRRMQLQGDTEGFLQRHDELRWPGSGAAEVVGPIDRSRAKWTPVRVKKTRQKNKSS